MKRKGHKMKEYKKKTMTHLRHWFSPFMELWVENATSFTSDYQIYYQRNVIYQSQQSQTE